MNNFVPFLLENYAWICKIVATFVFKWFQEEVSISVYIDAKERPSVGIYNFSASVQCWFSYFDFSQWLGHNYILTAFFYLQNFPKYFFSDSSLLSEMTVSYFLSHGTKKIPCKNLSMVNIKYNFKIPSLTEFIYPNLIPLWEVKYSPACLSKELIINSE